jgi:sugar phosphate isomerase/epimerase
MKLGLINSAWVQSGRGTAHGIRQTKAIGFDTIDIFADPLDIDAKERKLIRTECEAAGLPVVSVACVAVGLIDFNPSVQRFHMQRCQAYLDFCYELGAKNLLLVIGEYIWEKQVIPSAEQWATGVKHLKALGEYADKLWRGRSRRSCGRSRGRRSTFTSATATGRSTATCRRAAGWSISCRT